jgi:hypothetical protein
MKVIVQSLSEAFFAADRSTNVGNFLRSSKMAYTPGFGVTMSFSPIAGNF